jgi:hypothetical protein
MLGGRIKPGNGMTMPECLHFIKENIRIFIDTLETYMHPWELLT